jgi:hypothetical protein
MVSVRKWGWRGAGITVGAILAGGLAAAGQWRGGLAGAAVIAIGGFVAPEVSDWLRERRKRATDLDEASRPAVVAPAGREHGGPSWWLRPDQQVVTFIGRPELTRLRQWCTDPDEPLLALVTGAGGVGKTRLALKLAGELQESGWLCRIVRDGGEASVAGAALATGKRHVLLIVDYAETRPDLTALLRSATSATTGALRVMLLARSEGEWWAQLEASNDSDVRILTSTARRMPVSAAVGQATGEAEQVRRAIPEFARVLGVPVLVKADVTVPSKPTPILVLHTAALMAVLEARDHPGEQTVKVIADQRVLAGLLARERAFWLNSAKVAGLTGPGGLDSESSAQAVAIACLIPVSDEAEAARALRKVPGLDQSPATRQLARWLRQLYPASPPRWWGSLQPDLLAEQHATGQLAASPELAAAALRGLTQDQAREALTVLARASAHHPQARPLITAALRADLATLGIPAIEVALQAGGALGEVVAGALRDADATLQTLIDIENSIPYPTVTLAEAHAVLTERIIRALPQDTASADAARWRDRHGVLLSQLGRPARRPPGHPRSRHHPPRPRRRQPRPLPPRPRPVPDQPRRLVLGAGPPRRRPPGHPRSRHRLPRPRRRQPRPLPPRSRPIPDQPCERSG